MFSLSLRLLVMFVLISPGCSHSPSETPTAPAQKDSAVTSTTNANESKVYSTVLDGFRDRFGAQRLLILDETTMGIVLPQSKPEDVVRFLRKRLPDGIAPDLVEEFRKKNEQPVKLGGGKFASTVSYSIVNKQDEKLRGDWDEFYKNNPGAAIVQLSQVAFNEDASQALVYLSSNVGSRTGWGYYVFLTKNGEEWQIKNKELAWVS